MKHLKSNEGLFTWSLIELDIAIISLDTLCLETLNELAKWRILSRDTKRSRN